MALRFQHLRLFRRPSPDCTIAGLSQWRRVRSPPHGRRAPARAATARVLTACPPNVAGSLVELSGAVAEVHRLREQRYGTAAKAGSASTDGRDDQRVPSRSLSISIVHPLNMVVAIGGRYPSVQTSSGVQRHLKPAGAAGRRRCSMTGRRKLAEPRAGRHGHGRARWKLGSLPRRSAPALLECSRAMRCEKAGRQHAGGSWLCCMVLGPGGSGGISYVSAEPLGEHQGARLAAWIACTWARSVHIACFRAVGRECALVRSWHGTIMVGDIARDH